ncbi:MAG: serine dehydratase beta chain, partial [Ginsengibacter sp.]
MNHEAISVFDMFKIGVGPSSSHTLGPWKAATLFLFSLKEKKILEEVRGVKILLYGSLAKTGIGHGTDIAVQLGLSGDDPVTFDVDKIDHKIQNILESKKIFLDATFEVVFDPIRDIEFLMKESLPYHPNGLSFIAELNNGEKIKETYYSVGGGFVEQEGVITENSSTDVTLPFPINNAEDLLHWCRKTGLSIHEVVLENESTWRSEEETKAGVLTIWQVMKECLYKG